MKSTCLRRVFSLLLIGAMLLCLVGCRSFFDLPEDGGMPFNGNITFHELEITIPDDYIRDSTQSTDDAWIFEKGFYKRMIIITRNDHYGDVDKNLNEYMERMRDFGESYMTTFMDIPAVHTTYTKDNTYCQEMLFIYNGSYYAVALRGGSEADFRDLLDTVSFAKTSESDTQHN